jgi:2-iminobutanoate/2-iminopropanoate deaminase
MIERFSPAGVPAPRGPYSPAVRAGGFIYVSGQVPIDPATGQEVLKNIENCLAACGATLADVVRCGVYLTNIADFAAMNAVYAEVFGDAKPARSAIGVASLPLPGARVEIDAIAYKP